MTASKIEAALRPHMSTLRHLLKVLASNEGKALIAKASDIQAAYARGLEREDLAVRTQTAKMLTTASFQPVDNGQVVFSRFTPEVLDGLWQICYFGCSSAVKEALPTLRVRLRTKDFDYTSLAGALKRSQN